MMTPPLRMLFSKPNVANRLSLGGCLSTTLDRASNNLISPTSSIISQSPLLQQQYRYKSLTKTKRRQRDKMAERERRVAAGLPAKPRPPKYIPKDLPVINAMTRLDRDDESVSFDVASAVEMKEKITTQNEQEDTLRFGFDGLVMSDRVRKLLDLQNGSQKEVVSSQKRRGMELFQLREGDTGSSAVQVVALTTRIQQLQTHMARHKKDNSTKRGLDALYVRRRKVLDYMERKDFESYRKVVKSLGLAR
ncbi:ribosomal protein S15 [Skeletonema marinoi]|uniref:Ribosomal protein S15 n=1 Tax=Skeletonema marinoi TaxID=267567 RepID=A0AAD9D789_9STRA|nr:ribosomal protein S15 [Skeletonema marinoi]